MLGIAQYGDLFHYINWIPSESGPLVTDFGNLKINKNPNDNNWDYHKVFQSLIKFTSKDSYIFTLSIDLNLIKTSSIDFDENQEDMIEWYLNQASEKEFIELMDFYYYPMENKNSLFMLSIPKNLRSNVKEVVREQRTELRTLGAGIFSAELGARQWFHANKLESYLIWRLDKKNINQFLLIIKGKLSIYCVLKIRKNKIDLIQLLGSRSKCDDLINDLEQMEKKSTNKFLSCEKVYIYNVDGASKKIKSIENKNIENLVLLNPLNVLKNSMNKQYNVYKTLPLAETGLAFRGIDV